jgi:hypothetical protein
VQDAITLDDKVEGVYGIGDFEAQPRDLLGAGLGPYEGAGLGENKEDQNRDDE